MKEEPKRYEIKSFKELINVVTPENFENISTDLIHWLCHSMIYINELRKRYPKKYAKKTNWEIAECSFIWIDDGKNDTKELILKNNNTGEVTKIDLPPKDN